RLECLRQQAAVRGQGVIDVGEEIADVPQLLWQRRGAAKTHAPASLHVTILIPAAFRACWAAPPSLGRRSVNRLLMRLKGTTRTEAPRVHLLTSAARNW